MRNLCARAWLLILFVPQIMAATDEPMSTCIEEARLVSAAGRLETCFRTLESSIADGRADDADRYDFAYAAWRLNQALYAGGGDGAADRRETLLQTARTTLESLREQQPDDVEVLVLLAAVYGELIGDSRIRGMQLGAKASSVLDRAHRLGSDNPRVALQRGVSYFHTPAMFGGGVDKAVAELERARHLFASGDAGGSAWPSWGRVDAYAWLGQAMAKQGRTDDARAVYQEGLSIEPDAGWIRFALLPALDQGR